MSDIVKIVSPRLSAVQEDVVERIEQLLLRAKNGEIRTIAYCYAKPDGMPSEGILIPDNADWCIVHTGAAILLPMMNETMRERGVTSSPPEPTPSR